MSNFFLQDATCQEASEGRQQRKFGAGYSVRHEDNGSVIFAQQNQTRLLGALLPFFGEHRNPRLLDVGCDLAAIWPCHGGIVKTLHSLQTPGVLLQALGWDWSWEHTPMLS